MSSAVTSVPYLDLTTEFSQLQEEWLEAIRATGQSGAFILGPNVKAFEAEIASYVGVKHAVSVANGTDALVLSLRALGIGPGDEVITSPYTFYATSEAVNVVGATPVFADIFPDNYTLDPASVKSLVTNKTKAIIPVHIFGCPTNMTEIQKIADDHNLAIVEDCAQAFAASVGDKKVGSLGDAGCFSFYPTKVLGCYGDGGIITTDRDDVAEHLLRLRNHGATAPFMHSEVGYNSRLDEIQAAVLRIKLRTIDDAVAGRQAVASAYAERLAGKVLALPEQPGWGGHAYNLYTVRLKDRDACRQRLADNQIGSSLCYPKPLHLQEVYSGLNYQPGSLPVAEHASTEALSLPIYPGMPESHIDRVCEVLFQG
ncbi:MAG: DegT/DnrJ/EryC1/StrS family aminotransferase [Acidiferrobacterales bacterium]|jgi:dTDP-4-amino-4,6-dideoxygalactose transaminase|nr:DegT/DnrJ/EryC1/StrS family aminotransferase [Acidiferrobacterales bacterium]